eukprot:3727795-Pleurochrysis_carterae.AAC.3
MDCEHNHRHSSIGTAAATGKTKTSIRAAGVAWVTGHARATLLFRDAGKTEFLCKRRSRRGEVSDIEP